MSLYTLEDLIKKVAQLHKAADKLPVHELVDYGKDYIDYLGFRGNPIFHNAMKGWDGYGRNFYVFKITVFDPKVKPGPPPEDYQDETLFFMDTFFQRYTDGTAYQVCGHFMKQSIYTYGGTRPCQFQFYTDLLTKGKVTITEEIRPSEDNIVGWTAILGSKEEWEAAKIIQRNWRTVRKNPTYYMCKRVQLRDAMDFVGVFDHEDLKSIFPKWKKEDFKKVFPNI